MLAPLTKHTVYGGKTPLIRRYRTAPESFSRANRPASISTEFEKAGFVQHVLVGNGPHDSSAAYKDIVKLGNNFLAVFGYLMLLNEAEKLFRFNVHRELTTLLTNEMSSQNLSDASSPERNDTADLDSEGRSPRNFRDIFSQNALIDMLLGGAPKGSNHVYKGVVAVGSTLSPLAFCVTNALSVPNDRPYE